MFTPERVNASKKIYQVCDHSDRTIIPFKDQDYDCLKRECLRAGKLFEDPYFEAVDKSIFYNKSVPNGTEWARPGEISDKPLFIDGEPTAHDLDQGYLGDCKYLKYFFCFNIQEWVFK